MSKQYPFQKIQLNKLLCPPIYSIYFYQLFVALIARDPATQKLFAEQGSEAISSTPQAFAAEIAADIIKWTELMRKNGIKAE